MSDNIENLIKEVAVKHGVTIGKNDPILILTTINSRLIEDSQAGQKEILSEFKAELEEVTARWGIESKGKAERILTAALTASKEAMDQALEQGATKTVESIQIEIEDIVRPLTVQLKDMRRYSTWIFLASVIVFLASILNVFIAIFK
jgi:hypothetical protein